MKLKSMVTCVAIAVIAPAAVAACSSSTTTSSSSTSKSTSSTSSASSKNAVCSAADDLKQSMAALADPSLLIAGKSGIESAVNKVRSDVTALESAAKGSYTTETSAVKSSLDQLETAVGKLGNGNAGQNLQEIKTAITSLGTSISSVESALKTRCT